MLLNLILLFQKTTTTAAAATTETDSVASKSMFDVIASGGFVSIFIMSCLVSLSIYAIYIFIERYLTISKIAEVDQSFMNSVKANIKSGNIAAARAMCESTNSPIAKMIAKGIRRIGKPSEEIERAMEAVGRIEIFNMEKGVHTLSLISKLAPMFGFVGTIMGVIKIFYDISVTNDLSISVISGGLYTKMVTSAAGLIVGIIAFAGYFILTMMIDKVVVNLEKIAIDFMDLLHEPGA
jgi:biopolymer transport protein ExbB